MEQRCGNCVYFLEDTEIMVRYCNYPLPEWLGAIGARFIDPHYHGRRCPCFKPKEEDNGKV